MSSLKRKKTDLLSRVDDVKKKITVDENKLKDLPKDDIASLKSCIYNTYALCSIIEEDKLNDSIQTPEYTILDEGDYTVCFSFKDAVFSFGLLESFKNNYESQDFYVSAKESEVILSFIIKKY